MYNTQKHDELVAQEAKFSAAFNASGQVIETLMASDRTDVGHTGELANARERHSIHRERLNAVRAERKAMDQAKPDSLKGNDSVAMVLNTLMHRGKGKVNTEVEDFSAGCDRIQVVENDAGIAPGRTMGIPGVMPGSKGLRILNASADDTQTFPVGSNDTGGDSLRVDALREGIADSLKYYRTITMACKTETIDSVRQEKIPASLDKLEGGEMIVDEGTGWAEDPASFEHVNLRPVMFGSKRMAWSLQMNLNYPNMGSRVEEVGRQRVINEIEEQLTKNVGAAEGDPKGIIVSIKPSFKSGMAGGAKQETVKSLPYKLDNVYRGQAGAGVTLPQLEGGGFKGWMVSPTFEEFVMTLQETDGADLWRDSTRDFGLPMIRNYPYIVNPRMDDTNTDGNVPAVFGDFSYFLQLMGANGDTFVFPYWDSNTSPSYELVVVQFATGGAFGGFAVKADASYAASVPPRTSALVKYTIGA